MHTHIGHVADRFDGTPSGWGLLSMALSEGQIAVEHAGLAAADPFSLDAIKRHVGHVMHALDPALSSEGPGLGYGVKLAAVTAAQHIELAAAADGATDNVRLHAGHIASSLGNVAQRSDAMVALAQQILTATSAATAASPLAQLSVLSEALLRGRDGDGDGRVGWQAGEGGLQQASQHMTLMKRGEGLLN